MLAQLQIVLQSWHQIIWFWWLSKWELDKQCWVECSCVNRFNIPHFKHRCSLYIVTCCVPGKYISLKFNEFLLQDSYRCSADYLMIREANEDGRLLGTLCGSGIPPTVTSSTSLWLQLHSNWLLERKGFNLTYEVKGGCVFLCKWAFLATFRLALTRVPAYKTLLEVGWKAYIILIF